MAVETATRPTASVPPSTHHDRPALADPGALGLSAFALTTMVASFANAGLLPNAAAAALGVALFYGGVGQALAGLWSFRQGNTFGSLSFTSFGGFWLAYWWIQTNPDLARAAAGAGLGLFMICWAVVAAMLMVVSVRLSGLLIILFAWLALTLLLLGLGALIGITWIGQAGGWAGIATALIAWYGSFASVVNATWQRAVVPIGEIRIGS
ncbi:acetate uptake transporter [Curtobacterium luteum]|uniref:acetate uptake transporter n=1 Tax=Curtobacterium luteum TaxID=33881 RepID=UPI00381CC6AE